MDTFTKNVGVEGNLVTVEFEGELIKTFSSTCRTLELYRIDTSSLNVTDKEEWIVWESEPADVISNDRMQIHGPFHIGELENEFPDFGLELESESLKNETFGDTVRLKDVV